MKTLGIIGGFGPETAAEFELAVISRCRDAGMDKRPEIVMWNAPVSLHTEEDLILQGGHMEDFLPLLVRGAQILEKSGASFIALPCNTLHVFINQIRGAVAIPVLSIIDETVQRLVTAGSSTVAVFGTKLTTDNKLYKQQLDRNGVQTTELTRLEQSVLNDVIFDILSVTAHKRSTRILAEIAKECIRRGATDILLACTDLQMVFPKLPEVRVHDTMSILADACVREIMQSI